MQALDASSIAERVFALPQLVPHPIEAPIPESVVGLISQIIFGGKIPEHEKVSHYCLAGAYAMPSHGEGFGILFLEALACGVSVIGSKVDGSHEALLNGQLGCLVDPNVPEELVKAIADVLCNGSSRQRNNLVRYFDVAHFRSRAAEWLMERTTKDKSLGVSVRRPRSGETLMMGVRTEGVWAAERTRSFR